MYRLPSPRSSVYPDNYLEASSSRTQFATNGVWPLGAMTLFAQFICNSVNGANNQYLFSNCDSGGANGVRWSFATGAGLALGASSSGGALAPQRSTSTTMATATFYTAAVTWDGGILDTGIIPYLGIGSAPIVAETGTSIGSGSGSILTGTGQPVTIGGRQGGTTRILNGDEFVLAWWDGVLSPAEILRCQRDGPQTVRRGSQVLCMINGVDVGPYKWIPSTRQGIIVGKPLPDVAPYQPIEMPFDIGFTTASPSLNRGTLAILG